MITFNIFTGNFDFVGSSGSSSNFLFPEVYVDPANPVVGESWVLAQSSVNRGDLLAFYGAMPLLDQSTCDFFLSIKTSEGIRRVEIS